MKQVPLYEQIYIKILEEIKNGKYRPCQKLPSEKELADFYHVSRITVKKAMGMLAEENRVIRLRGKGSFVSEKCIEKTIMKKSTNASSKLIGVILDGFSPSFACDILYSIQRECEEKGFNMVLRCSGGSLQRETNAIEELVELGVCGFIIMCVHDENYNERILQLVIDHFPIVTIDRQLKGLPVPFVGTDNVAAARDLTKILFDRGYRKVGLVRPKAHKTITLLDRQRGFEMAFQDYNRIVDESLWITDLCSTLPEMMNEENLQQDIEVIDSYLEQHGDIEAFMASEYNVAQILKYCLKKAGRYQEDMIVCFDGPELFFCDSEFTHVKQGESEIGRKSMEILLKAIYGEEHPNAIIIPYLIKGKTGENTNEDTYHFKK
ncbi:GntR family transcriptional regulator [Clostridiales bacterium COT073_COT-073]|nr:GntR family transcriptional regulator [Clostridiales bacterium COT073_COT-073]